MGGHPTTMDHERRAYLLDIECGPSKGQSNLVVHSKERRDRSEDSIVGKEQNLSDLFGVLLVDDQGLQNHRGLVL